jgi:muramoyltetrapeptide carboxypeptidase LdcA involved in peptidoglycan recycling
MDENNQRLHRLENADFNKNINIVADVKGQNTNSLIKQIEFKNRLAYAM